MNLSSGRYFIKDVLKFPTVSVTATPTFPRSLSENELIVRQVFEDMFSHSATRYLSYLSLIAMNGCV